VPPRIQPTTSDRGLVAALVGRYGGIRPAQRALADAGVKFGRGFFDGQLRGQAKSISKASGEKLNAFLGKLTPQERRDIRDDRRRIIADTANDPRRIAREAKRAAARDEAGRKAELSRFRKELRDEQRRSKRRRQPPLGEGGGGGGGGGGEGGGAGGETTSDDDMLERYDEYLIELDQDDDVFGEEWEPPEDLPF
jgi:hypothetical protein